MQKIGSTWDSQIDAIESRSKEEIERFLKAKGEGILDDLRTIRFLAPAPWSFIKTVEQQMEDYPRDAREEAELQ